MSWLLFHAIQLAQALRLPWIAVADDCPCSGLEVHYKQKGPIWPELTAGEFKLKFWLEKSQQVGLYINGEQNNEL